MSILLWMECQSGRRERGSMIVMAWHPTLQAENFDGELTRLKVRECDVDPAKFKIINMQTSYVFYGFDPPNNTAFVYRSFLLRTQKVF